MKTMKNRRPTRDTTVLILAFVIGVIFSEANALADSCSAPAVSNVVCRQNGDLGYNFTDPGCSITCGSKAHCREAYCYNAEGSSGTIDWKWSSSDCHCEEDLAEAARDNRKREEDARLAAFHQEQITDLNAQIRRVVAKPFYGVAISNFGSGLCVAMDENSKDDGAMALQWRCTDPAAHLRFNLEPVGARYVQIRNRNSNRCLDIPAFAIWEGAVVQQWKCNRTENQLFAVFSNEDGTKTLRPKNSGLCLAIESDSAQEGALLVQTRCSDDNDSQKFLIKK